MTAGLLAAAAAAVCYGVASVLQAVASRRTAGGARLDPRLLTRLARQGPYLAGLALDLAGFLLSVVALHSLPLFLVQSVVAASVGVTALVAAATLRMRLRRVEVSALSALVLGLVLLAVGAKPGHGHSLPHPAQWALLALVPVVAALGAAAARRPDHLAVVLVAGLAGVAFAAVGVAARGLAVPHPLWRVVTQPSAWALVGFGVLGSLLFATALQRGSVTVASAVMSAVETVVPSAVGFAALGDATRPGIGVAAAAAGFALALGGAVALAPYAEPVAGS